jgi:hypothetical protein
MPSPSEVSNFQRLIAQLSAAAVNAAAALFRATASVEELKEAYPELVDPYLAGAAEMTAEWYASLAPESDFAVDVPELTPLEALRASTGWALKQFDPVTAISGSTERRVFTTSRNTVHLNAEREHVRYARHASANACPWCRVLATREPVYHSADNAVKGHDNCHCVAVPIREGSDWEPAPYVRGWMNEYQTARREVGGNLNDIVNHMRRTSPQGD